MIRRTSPIIDCLVDDCNAGVFARGLCKPHYQQERYAGRLDQFPLFARDVLESSRVDEIAVGLACAGEPVALTRTERRLAVRRLHERGCSDPRIAYLLHVSERTVIRYRHHLGLPGLALADMTEMQRAA